MATVYLAYDPHFKRRVALKVLPREFLHDQHFQARFEREATTIAALEHAAIVPVYDFNVEEGQPYLVMRYMPGGSLEERLKQGPLSLAETAALFPRLCSALDKAHAQKVIHRDLKPGNILFDGDGDPYIADFGIAKLSEATTTLTAGSIIGTPAYMSPEQGRGSPEIDGRSDVYALGAILYQLLSGQLPFNSTTPHGMIIQHITDPLPDIRRVKPELPAGVQELIARAMAKDPAERYATAGALARALTALAAAPAPEAEAPRLTPAAPASGQTTQLDSQPAQPTAPRPEIQAAPTPATDETRLKPGAAAPASGQTTQLDSQPALPLLARPPAGPLQPQSGPRPAVQPAPAWQPVRQPAPAPRANRTWLWVAGAGMGLLALCGLVFGGMILSSLNPPTVAPTAAAVITAAPTKPVELPTSGPTSGPASEPTSGPVTKPTSSPTSETLPEAASWKAKDPTTWTEVTFGGPETLDPALCYETSGAAIIQNVYDTLIFYNRDNPNELIPQLATEVPSLENGGISADGKTITFRIRTGVKFHNGATMTPADVAYTFQRGLLQGGGASPQWLLVEPLFGVGLTDVSELVGLQAQVEAPYDDPATLATIDPTALQEVCRQVTAAIVANNAAGTVTFHLAQPWAPFLTTLAQSWGAIQSREWVMANGGWDGNCATWQNYYGKSSDQLNETPLGTTAMGTGPYILDHWTRGEEVVLRANEAYWRTEPAWEGGPSGAPALKTVIIRQVDEFATRYAMLQAGDADNIAVGSSSDYPQMDELVGVTCTLDEYYAGTCAETDANQPLVRVTGLQSTARTDAFFTFVMNTADGNNFIGSGRLDGNGIPANFFSDVHVRRAFAYCFNYDEYLNNALAGEAIRSNNVMLPGMIGYQDEAPIYTYDPGKCEAELRLSRWTEGWPDENGNPTYTPDEGGAISLWETGFRMTLAYNTDNTHRQTVAQIFQGELSSVNPNFIVEVTGLPWPTFLQNQRASKLPIFISGWIEDIHDPHNWMVPYVTGTYGSRQKMADELKAQLAEIINRAVAEPDPAKRAAFYAQFNWLYYEQIPTMLLYVQTGRRYQPRYVEGWYFNTIYPGAYFYPLSKR
jgi:peptide/nickel transport system substrate-binding protein